VHSEGSAYMVDAVTKFYNMVRISGWFHRQDDTLSGVELLGEELLSSVSEVGLAHEGVASLGANKGFSVQALRRHADGGPVGRLQFRTKRGWRGEASLTALSEEHAVGMATGGMMQRFIAAVEAIPNARLLDIGGRARSGLDRRRQFRISDYVVLDILPGSNVDVVGDAHGLAALFPEASFDAIISVSVFEHLLMPWTVVTQMNAALKPGGIALVFTHQTLGMHDLPWDFWRFSDTAWDGLFNTYTGFEIVERAMDRPHYIIPMIWAPEKEGAEKAIGFEGSAVLVRKTGPCRMAWAIAPADVTATTYPAGEMPAP